MIRPTRHALTVPFVLSAALAIGCGATTEERETTPDGRSSEVAVQPASADAPVAIHEWGVIDYTTGVPHVRTRPAPPPPSPGGTPRVDFEMTTVDKPVLYVHLLDGAESARIDVRLGVNRGGVAELFPLMLPDSLGMPGEDGEPQDEVELADAEEVDGLTDDRIAADLPALREIFWQGVEVGPGECVGTQSYPGMDSDLCRGPLSVDGVCEVASLREYETRDGACLRYGGQTYEHLFYRLRMAALQSPIHAEPGGDGVTVYNRGQRDVPGPIFVVQRPGFSVVQAGVPAGGNAQATHLGNRSDFFRALGTALLEMGLTEDEAVAFERAWNREFVRIGPNEISVVYRLPTETVEALAPLRVTPAPRALTRVWMAFHRRALTTASP